METIVTTDTKKIAEATRATKTTKTAIATKTKHSLTELERIEQWKAAIDRLSHYEKLIGTAFTLYLVAFSLVMDKLQDHNVIGPLILVLTSISFIHLILMSTDVAQALRKLEDDSSTLTFFHLCAKDRNGFSLVSFSFIVLSPIVATGVATVVLNSEVPNLYWAILGCIGYFSFCACLLYDRFTSVRQHFGVSDND